jgi:diguanylate cyclase (GGDEF)-like protein/PAS domain S-box-containing protein
LKNVRTASQEMYMDISHQIEAVYQRALQLRALAVESPVSKDLLEKALQELYYVLEELQTSQDELHQQNQALQRAWQMVEAERQRYEDLFNLAPDGYLVTDRTGLIQEANYAIASMLKMSRLHLVGKPLVLFIPEEMRSEFHAKLTNLNRVNTSDQPRFKDWETRLCPHHSDPFDVAITLSITRTANSTVSSFRWLFRDITQQKQATATIRHQAFYDQLTGLPNRASFDDHLKRAIAQAERHNEGLAVIFLDLDRFKAINDTFGHAAGDWVLKEAAQRLKSCLREEDLLVRWGGDEFALVLHHVESREVVAHTCERILTSLHGTFQIDVHALAITTSMGVALFPQDGSNPDRLLRRADRALYAAKVAGRNTYHFFNASIGSEGSEGASHSRDPSP